MSGGLLGAEDELPDVRRVPAARPSICSRCGGSRGDDTPRGPLCSACAEKAARAAILPPVPPVTLDDAIILRADRRNAAAAMADLGKFGGIREARQVMLALAPLEDTRASMARTVAATTDRAERWRLRGCQLLAGAATPEEIESWYLEAVQAAREADDGDTEPGVDHG